MLLNDIIALATDDTKSLSSLLRKCLVLAHQIKNERLKNWANQELNGYASTDQLPDYRRSSAQAKGDFAGLGGTRSEMHIPPSVLEERHRQFATDVWLFQGVRVYEDIVANAEKGYVSAQWPADLVFYYQNRLPTFQRTSLLGATQEFTKGALVGLLDAVRTRVLNIALEIKDELGEKDEDLKSLTLEKSDKVDRTVTTIIYGGTNVIATGHSSVNSTINQQQIIEAGDWEHLVDVLHHSGLPESKVAELKEAIDSDGKKTIGAKVSTWIKNTAPEVLAGGVKIGTAAAQSVLTEWLKQYFGM